MIAKVELDSFSALSAPETCRTAGKPGDVDACPALSFNAASPSSQSPPAFCDVEPDEKSDNEENAEMLLNWSSDLKLRRACAKLVASVNKTLPSESPLACCDATSDDGSDHEDDIEMLFNWICESELRQVLLQLMNSESAGPFLEGNRDNALGLRTIQQRLTDGRYVDVAGQTSAELFWSDLDKCLDICVANGRFPIAVWKMRKLAQQSEKDFWNFRDGFKSFLHTMHPSLRPAAAVACVVGGKAENYVPAWADIACMRIGQCVGDFLNECCHGYRLFD